MEKLLSFQILPCSPCILQLGFCWNSPDGWVSSVPNYSESIQVKECKVKPSDTQLNIFMAGSCHDMPTWKRAGISSGFLVVQGGDVMGNWRGRCFCAQLGSLYLNSQFEKALKTQPYVYLIRWLPHLHSWQDWKGSLWFHLSIGKVGCERTLKAGEVNKGRWSSFFKVAIIIKISCILHCFYKVSDS